MKRLLSIFSLDAYLPLGIVVFFWFVLASPYLLYHNIPYPADQLTNNYAPWSDYPQFHGPVKNPALSDVVTQIFPWKHLVIGAYMSGHLPVWNQHSFAGSPLIANYQSAAFSPLNLLFFILPFIDAWSLLVLLQPLLAGIGTYFFVSSLTKEKLAGALSGIVFMFCGFITVWMEYGTLSYAASMLPWVLFSIEKIQQKQTWLWTILGGIFLAISYLAGHFQTSLYVSIFSCAYAVFCKEKQRQVLISIIILFGCGILVSLLQIVPTLAIFNQVVRSTEVFTDAGIPWWYLVTAFAPDFFGNPSKYNDFVGHYAEWAPFVGVIPILLVWFVQLTNKRVRFFVACGFVSLLFALRTPMLSLLSMSHIPVLSSSYPTRVIVLFAFSIAVLAGYGFAHIREKEVRGNRVILAIASSAIFLFISLFSSYFMLSRELFIISMRNSVYPIVYICLGIVILIAFWKGVSSRWKQLLSIILIFLAGMQGVLFAKQWLPFSSYQQVYPQLPVISQMEEQREGGRIYGVLSNAVYSYYGLPAIEGYDPIYSQRYSDFIRASDKSADFGLNRSEITISPRSKHVDRMFNLLGVSLLYQPKSHAFQPWAYPVWEKGDMWEKVYEDTQVGLYKNKQALGIATLFCNYEIITDKQALLSRFYAEDFAYKTTLLVQSRPAQSYGTYCTEVNGRIEVQDANEEAMTIKVATKEPALLFISENYFSSRKITVNGRAALIYPADLAFIAVEVPKGESTVILSSLLF